MKKFFSVLFGTLLFLQVAACGLFGNNYVQRVAAGEDLLQDFARNNTSSNVQPAQPAESKKVTLTPPARVGIELSSSAANYVHFEEQLPRKSAYYAVIPNRGGYESLTGDYLKECYAQFSRNVYTIADKPNDKGYYAIKSVTIKNLHVEESEIRKVINAFKIDNPQVFWLKNIFGYAYSNKDTIIELYSVLPPNECGLYQAKVNTAVNQMIASLPSGLSEFDRELRIHDWIADHCSYDYQTAVDFVKWEPFTVYGAVVQGSAVCEGYARAMQLLLSYAGMQSRLVCGSGQGSKHMWNAVRVDGAWYHLDATWDDSDTMRIYSYFNVPDDVILLDHQIDPDYSSLSAVQISGSQTSAPVSYNLSVPACTSDAANYFKKEALVISSLDGHNDSSIINSIAIDAKDRQEYLSFTIADSMDYDTAIKRIFQEPPYKLLYYIDAVNKRSDKVHTIDQAHIVYSEVKDLRAVTIKLSYAN